MEAEGQALKQKYNEDVFREKKLARELEELKISIGQISTRKKMIEEMESSYEGYNNAVKFIMKSNLAGINGVVAELIEVPRGFETAIETALGAALQNIVCEDDGHAQNAIRLLKENKAGRTDVSPDQEHEGFRHEVRPKHEECRRFQGFRRSVR